MPMPWRILHVHAVENTASEMLLSLYDCKIQGIGIYSFLLATNKQAISIICSFVARIITLYGPALTK
jgi:hypothetical protein